VRCPIELPPPGECVPKVRRCVCVPDGSRASRTIHPHIQPAAYCDFARNAPPYFQNSNGAGTPITIATKANKLFPLDKKTSISYALSQESIDNLPPVTQSVVHCRSEERETEACQRSQATDCSYCAGCILGIAVNDVRLNGIVSGDRCASKEKSSDV
jgi:hypothetical protein